MGVQKSTPSEFTCANATYCSALSGTDVTATVLTPEPGKAGGELGVPGGGPAGVPGRGLMERTAGRAPGIGVLGTRQCCSDASAGAGIGACRVGAGIGVLGTPWK